MRKQFKKVAFGVACAMAIAVTAPAAQTSYAGTTVYEVTLGTPERRAIAEESLNVGETIDLNFYGVKDWNQNKANYKCKWTASGDAVTVSNMGVVTAVKGGTAVITLTVTDKVTGVSHNIAPTTITVVAEPTATPAPTATPVPTEAPKPTEAPVVETKEWETVLRELHSLETYAEREVYVAGLDASKYKVEQTENFDLINKCNSGEVEVTDTENKTQVGYELRNDYGDIVATYTFEELPDDQRDAILSADGFVYYPDYDCYEHDQYEPCFVKPVYEYGTTTVNAEAVLDVFVPIMWGEGIGLEDAPAYLMTLTNVATGETDPWGIVTSVPRFDGEEGYLAHTLEAEVCAYNRDVDALLDISGRRDVYALYAYRDKPVHYIETWDTLKYYEDLVSLRFEQ